MRAQKAKTKQQLSTMPPCTCKIVFYEYSAFQQHSTYALTEVIHTRRGNLLILYAGHILEDLIVDGALR